MTYPKKSYELNVDFKKKGESGGPFGGLFKNLFKAPAGGWFQHPFKASHTFSHSFQNPFHHKTTPAPTTTTTEDPDFGGSDFGTDSDIKDIDVKDVAVAEENVNEPIPEINSGAEANTNEHAGYDKNSQEVAVPVKVETKEEIDAGNVILGVNSLSNSSYDDSIIEITTPHHSHGYENHAHDVSIETIPLIYLPPTQDPPRLYLPSN